MSQSQSQPQAKLPREFKFVGGPSRKRRRRAEPPRPAPAAQSTASAALLLPSSPSPSAASPSSSTAATAETATKTTRNATKETPPETTATTVVSHSSAPETVNPSATECVLSQHSDYPAQWPDKSDNNSSIGPYMNMQQLDSLNGLLDWPGDLPVSTICDATSGLGDTFALFGGPLHALHPPAIGDFDVSVLSGSHSKVANEGQGTGTVVDDQRADDDADVDDENDVDGADRDGCGGGGGANTDQSASSPRVLVDDVRSSSSAITPSTTVPSPLPRSPRGWQGRIAGAVAGLLSQYDQEFCVLPLTADFDANPFRCNVSLDHASPLVLHSVLALSYRHIDRSRGSSFSSDADDHKSQVLKLLRESGRSTSADRRSRLDAVLVLFTLDCATSALGPWVSHLTLASQVLEATGWLRCPPNSRIRAQIEMLMWWDVTLAMTNRKGFVFSERSIRQIFTTGHSDDTDSFYDISGCPLDLFHHMVRLGSYAHELELASRMTCVNFNPKPVIVVEKAIKEWHNVQYSDFFDLRGVEEIDTADMNPETANYRQDLHHCAEAWRFALLIYIERVFKWDRQGRAPQVLELLSRKVFNHVLCCRRTNMVQKQLLLPVFLAGSETEDKHLRQVARDYCDWWTQRTRYDMFLTTLALLEAIWSTDNQTRWWGEAIDKKTALHNQGGASKQYLFG